MDRVILQAKQSAQDLVAQIVIEDNNTGERYEAEYDENYDFRSENTDDGAVMQSFEQALEAEMHAMGYLVSAEYNEETNSIIFYPTPIS